jgi:TolB-like protein/DNA-binding winged helix-turn-helix (wHTH) protein/Tfp pilus assembly protein PilF
MGHETNTPARYRIADLELDSGIASVGRKGAEVPMPKLSFDFLLCLARHAPNVVSTDTLMNEVWGKTVVGEETVKQRAKLLRQALGEDSRDPVYFEAVRGRGYRMIAEVAVPTGHSVSKSVKRPWIIAAISTVTLLLVLLAGTWFRNTTGPVNEGNRRVAVLPLTSIGTPTGNDYVADGMTEEIITALAQLTDLRIIARTSIMQYKGTTRPISEIAAELNVGTVIEGSVQHFEDELRITVQMIDAATEEHYWAQTFDVSLSNLPRMQVELAERVANSLAATISETGREAIRRSSTRVPDAYTLYLKGRAAYRRWTRQDNETALAFYRQSLELDPGFALAIAGAANALALKATEFGGGSQWAIEAANEANRALAINPSLPEAHKALGIVHVFDGRYRSATDQTLEALRLEPNYDEALFNLAETYMQLGRWDEAVRYQIQDRFRPLGREALSIYLRDLGFQEEADRISEPLMTELPVSFFGDQSRSLHYLINGDFDQARKYARRTQSLFPNQSAGWVREGEIDLRAGDLVKAEENMQIAVEMPGFPDRYANMRLAQLLMKRGETARGEALLNEVANFSQNSIDNGHEGWFHRWKLAFIYSLRGEKEAALGWFEKAVEAGRRRYEWDEQESAFENIAAEPRFQAALERQRDARAQMKLAVERMLEGSLFQ